MENNKFFQLLWRFNAISIALFSLVGVGFFTLAIFVLVDNQQTGKQTQQSTKKTQTPQNYDGGDKERFWLSNDVIPVVGTDWVKIPLHSNQARVVKAYGKKRPEPTRNIAFLHTVNGEMRWLFDSNDYMIFDTDIKLSSPPQRNSLQGDAKSSIATWYKVYKEDTNGDGKITYSGDVFSLALSKPDGSHYREVIEGIDYHIVDVLPVGDDAAYFTYHKNRQRFISKINLSALTVIATQAFPEVPTLK